MSRLSRNGLFVLGALLIVVPATSDAQVYRCAEDGKTVYRDRPCVSGGKGVEIAVPTSAPEDAERARLQHEANMGRLLVGQSPRQVEMAWGIPKNKNIDTGSSGRTEQWVYERPEGRSYVYFRNGAMSSFSQHQEAPGSTPSPIPTPVVARPTRAEVEAQERADKAGERKFLRDRGNQSDVVKRIGEPDTKTFDAGQECWYYSATRLDPQTNTRICFTASGFVFDVERTVKHN